MYFPVPADHQVKLKEGEKRDKYLGLAKELKKKKQKKKTMEHKSDNDTNWKWHARRVTKRLVQGLEELEIRIRVDTIRTTV